MQLSLDHLEMVVELTPSEVRVLRHLLLGLTNAEIADRVGCDKRTVQAHMTHLLAKTEFTNRTALALWAVKLPEFQE